MGKLFSWIHQLLKVELFWSNNCLSSIVDQYVDSCEFLLYFCYQLRDLRGWGKVALNYVQSLCPNFIVLLLAISQECIFEESRCCYNSSTISQKFQSYLKTYLYSGTSYQSNKIFEISALCSFGVVEITTIRTKTVIKMMNVGKILLTNVTF